VGGLIDRADWTAWVCEDVAALVRAAEARHGAAVVSVYADRKSGCAEVTLSAPLPAAAVEALRGTIEAGGPVRFVDGVAACQAHCCSVRLGAPAPADMPRGPAWRRAARWVIARVRGGDR
jgi:hypothetical protein